MRFKRTRQNQRRRGIAITELAVCLPVLLLISISVIELATLIFAKQALTIAAYEGAHRAVQPAATAADATAAAQAILDQRRITGAQITVTPANLAAVNIGDFFTVQVTAPAAPNTIGIFQQFAGITLDSQAVAMKETESR